MSLARIISARPEDVVSLEQELRGHGFVTEVVVPGEQCAHPADIEISVEAISPEAARDRIRELQSFVGEVLVAKGIAGQIAPKQVVPQQAGPVINGAAPTERQESAGAHDSDVSPDRDAMEFIPAVVPAPVALPEKRAVAENELLSITHHKEEPRGRVAARPPVQRKPFVRPLLSKIADDLGSAAKQASAASRGAAGLAWRAARAVGARTVRGAKAGLPVIQTQAATGVRGLSGLAAASQRALRELYAATRARLRRQRASRRSRTLVPVEDAQTAAKAQQGVIDPHAQAGPPVRLNTKATTSRRRDWEVAVVGAAIASCVIVIIFGVTSRPIKAAAAGPSHAAITVTVNPAATAAPKPDTNIQPRQQAPARARETRSHQRQETDDSYADDVIVRHYNAPPNRQASQRTSGVKYYSDEP